MHTQKLITEAQAAERYGLSISWFQKKRVEGGGPPFVKLSRAVRYDVEQTDKFFSERTRNSTSGEAA